MDSAWQWNQVLGGQPSLVSIFPKSLDGEGTLGVPLPTFLMDQQRPPGMPSDCAVFPVQKALPQPSSLVTSSPWIFLSMFYEESKAWRRQVSEVTELKSSWAGTQTHVSQRRVLRSQTPPAALPSPWGEQRTAMVWMQKHLFPGVGPACLGPVCLAQLCALGDALLRAPASHLAPKVNNVDLRRSGPWRLL